MRLDLHSFNLVGGLVISLVDLNFWDIVVRLSCISSSSCFDIRGLLGGGAFFGYCYWSGFCLLDYLALDS